MLRRSARLAAFTLVVLLVAGGLLYAFGLRIMLDGGGTPHLRLVESDRAHTERIARHREAQRATATDDHGRPRTPQATDDHGTTRTLQATDEHGTTRTLQATDEHGQTRTVQVPDEHGAARSGASRSEPYWTEFRGPGRDGHYRERPIRTVWPSEGLTPLWKQPVGGGYASFVAAGGRAFTIEQRGPQELVAAYEVVTGRELWTNGWTAAFRERMGGDGPRATPTWADGRVYALGAQGELRALDEATGQMIWRTNILEDAGASNLQWGMAASPLVVDDTVVVLPGGSNGRSVVAYNRSTGTRVWSAHGDQQAYSSPMLATLAGVRQILVFSATRLMGLTPDRGELLWEYPWKTQFDINAAQPLVLGDNRVFLSSGYGTGAAVLELSPADGGLSVREVWRNIRMKNQFTSSVLHDGFIYGLDESILACVDAATGELKWKGGRYGYGQVLLASGHLIVLTEDGDLALVRATPERHEEQVRFPVLDGKTWNHPAMADGYLLVRNLREMAAFDLRVRER